VSDVGEIDVSAASVDSVFVPDDIAAQIIGYIKDKIWARVMVLSATFNNISVISGRSILLVEETGVPGENQRPATRLTDKLYHIMLY
jgi:hypothetical protein